MNEHRYLEDDFNIFIHELLGSKDPNASEEEIARLVLEKGYNSLTDKQKSLFEEFISPYVYDTCATCGEDIPWSEMSGAEDNDGQCSWCYNVRY